MAQQLFSAMLVAQAVGPAFARDHPEGERRAAMLLGLTRTALGEMRERSRSCAHFGLTRRQRHLHTSPPSRT